MIARWLISLGISLALTLLIELTVSVFSGMRKKAILVILLANILTNPPVVLTVLILKWHLTAHLLIWIFGLELLAFLAEGWIYRFWPEEFSHPWRFSFILNCLSFLLGNIIQIII